MARRSLWRPPWKLPGFCLSKVMVILAATANLAAAANLTLSDPGVETFSPGSTQEPLVSEESGDFLVHEGGDAHAGPAVMLYAGEAMPWTAYGVLVERPGVDAPLFVAVGAGRFRQATWPHAQEELDIKALARSVTVGGQWLPLSRYLSLRAGLGYSSFTGSFTQRGTDITSDPVADDLLGSGFSAQVIHVSVASVLTCDAGPVRFEFVPVGFRFTVWRSIDQDRPTPHQVGLNRYLGGNSVFGLLNLAIGTSF
ncbi:hypothetical protein EBZ80_11760 [bacterium]|nr:hypothetical protein [bacterium]